MHIAFLNPQGNFDPLDSHWAQHPDFGGQLVYVKEVALALAELGHQVDIVTRRVADPVWPEFSEPLDAYPDAPNTRIIRLDCGGPAFLPKEALWPHLVREWVPNIISFYRDEGRLPDAFTTHYGDGGLAGALLQTQTGVPFTVTGHSLGAQKLDKLLANGATRAGLTDEILRPLDSRFHFGRRLAAERLAMDRASKIITSTRQERFEQYGHPAYRDAIDPLDDARFAVIPPGVNLKLFDASVRNEQEEQVARFLDSVVDRDIDPGRRHLPLILYSSRVDRKKNHMGLLKAFAQDPKLQAQANVGLVIRGADNALAERQRFTGETRALLGAMSELCERADLFGKVSSFPLEGQSQLAAAYRALAQRKSVFCLTAFHEPFGLAPLEAMAAGLPAVVTKNGGPSESLREGEQEFGILVDPADPVDIARGLRRLLGDDQAWQRFAQAGRQRVLDRYTWQRTARGYEAVLEEIAGGRHPGKERLPTPPYFVEPSLDNDISLAELAAMVAGQD
ncbi:MAG: glycosyltransferase [Chloroflexota bacterium]|nr:glycosyltransferase [Chloroflexota bacterium]